MKFNLFYVGEFILKVWVRLGAFLFVISMKQVLSRFMVSLLAVHQFENLSSSELQVVSAAWMEVFLKQRVVSSAYNIGKLFFR